MAEQIQYKSFSELDYQNIKDLLKNHLKTQDILKDFNFEGSTLNVILNLLAYNNQYMAYYLNMLASEKFISTAQKRESVVGSANNIGYVPYSRNSSTAYLSFTITPDFGYTNSIFIPKNVKFTTTIDGISYSFLTTQNTTVIPVNGVYNVTDLEVKEGKFFLHQFTIRGSDKFLTIPNKGLDYNRLIVSIKESSSSSVSTSYSKYTTLTDLSSNSNVYFIQEGIGGLYQLYFGDGILGKSISVGNIVSVEYYTTSGNAANNASSFVLDDEVTGLSAVNFTDVIASSGGALEESIDSLRLSAPTNYQAQNRATVEADYEILIRQIYTDAKQVSAIGGEKVVPPQYGKVFISILKNNLDVLSQRDKDYIVTQLNAKYSGLTVFPTIVDPYIIRMLINTTVKYKNLNSTQAEIESLVFNTIKSFVTTELNSFKYTLRKSKFEALIDKSSESILSNSTTFLLFIDTNDAVITTQTNVLTFLQALKPKTLTSSVFTYKTIQNCKFFDIDGSGFASIYSIALDGTLILVKDNVVSIDYNLGVVKYLDSNYPLKTLSVQNASGIKFIVETLNDDIVVKNNAVLFVNDNNININVLVEN